MSSLYVPCNVAKDQLLELCPYWTSFTAEQMVRLKSPCSDDKPTYELPWVWMKLSDLAPLLFGGEEPLEKEGETDGSNND